MQSAKRVSGAGAHKRNSTDVSAAQMLACFISFLLNTLACPQTHPSFHLRRMPFGKPHQEEETADLPAPAPAPA
eukprot:scaffold288922_cov19-Tisochrysis_lutea.AAC.1